MVRVSLGSLGSLFQRGYLGLGLTALCFSARYFGSPSLREPEKPLRIKRHIVGVGGVASDMIIVPGAFT